MSQPKRAPVAWDPAHPRRARRLVKLAAAMLPAAALVYKRAQPVINLFLWPNKGGKDEAVQRFAWRGYCAYRWSTDGMNYWAVSDVNDADLKKFHDLVALDAQPAGAGIAGRLGCLPRSWLHRVRARYVPVMKLVPDDAGGYAVHRMTYRGTGGWSWPSAHGPLAQVARKFLGLDGTDRFFELV